MSATPNPCPKSVSHALSARWTSGTRYAQCHGVPGSGVNTAATWDVELVYKRGSALREKVKGLEIQVRLGPGRFRMRQEMGGVFSGSVSHGVCDD